MNHSRKQTSLIRTLDPETNDRVDHEVKRQQVSKWVKAFRAEGFKVTMVIHDYKGEVQ